MFMAQRSHTAAILDGKREHAIRSVRGSHDRPRRDANLEKLVRPGGCSISEGGTGTFRQLTKLRVRVPVSH